MRRFIEAYTINTDPPPISRMRERMMMAVSKLQ